MFRRMPRKDPASDLSSDAMDSEQVALAFRRASYAVQHSLIAQARASDLGLLDFLVLCRAAEGDGGIVPGEVGRSLGLSTSTMTGLADRLEQAQLMRRVAHPTDRRLVLLQATAKGRRLTDKVLDPMLSELAGLAGQLPASERSAIGRFLDDTTTLITDHASALPPRRGSFRARSTAARQPE